MKRVFHSTEENPFLDPAYIAELKENLSAREAFVELFQTEKRSVKMYEDTADLQAMVDDLQSGKRDVVATVVQLIHMVMHMRRLIDALLSDLPGEP